MCIDMYQADGLMHEKHNFYLFCIMPSICSVDCTYNNTKISSVVVK